MTPENLGFSWMSSDVGTLLANIIGGWEITLLLAVAFILVLYGTGKTPPRISGMPDGLADPNPPAPKPRSRSDEFALWIAQGFDVGRMPFAPGTFGSLVGLLWFAILLVPGSLALFFTGTFIGLVLSVWFCGEAERILKQTDPGSIVLDEIAAMPVCFLPWLLREYHRIGTMPAVEQFFSGHALLHTAGLFVLFRIFDVAKPWPVRQSQGLPGGVGVTMDDLLAALYVAFIASFFPA